MSRKTLPYLSKSMRPLPEKWHGLTDVETRYRQRYVDLIMNDHVRDVFVTRSRIIQSLQCIFLFKRDFLEVETPMMQPIPGGRDGQALHHPSQCVGHGSLHAGCSGALLETPGGGGA